MMKTNLFSLPSRCAISRARSSLRTRVIAAEEHPIEAGESALELVCVLGDLLFHARIQAH